MILWTMYLDTLQKVTTNLCSLLCAIFIVWGQQHEVTVITHLSINTSLFCLPIQTEVPGLTILFLLHHRSTIQCHNSRRWTEAQSNVLTWNLRMMVQMRPRVSRELPSTISWAPMFSRCTRCSCRKVKALSTFSRQWILILPLVGRGCNRRRILSHNYISRSSCNLTHLYSKVLKQIYTIQLKT